MIFTIGYGGVPLPRLIAALVDEGFPALVDVRQVPQSKSQRMYCQENLSAALALNKIDYLHAPALGNPFREECIAADSLRPYEEHLAANPGALDVLEAFVDTGAALLCGCPLPHRCHRSVIAAAAQKRWPGLVVRHLRPPQGEDRGPPPRILGVTLRQPWPWAIAAGHVRLINRPTRPRCPNGTYLAIAASKRPPDLRLCTAMRQKGFPPPDPISASSIVAVGQLNGAAVSTTGVADDQVQWWTGPVGWELVNVVAIEPLVCEPGRGLWRIEEETLPELRARYRRAR